MLAMTRRLELLAWAREAGAWIIEDDYHSEYRYAGRPLAALQGLDEAERVIYVGTFNKVLFPGLRLGYAVVPPPLIESFAGARFLIDRQAPTLSQALVAEFMRQGYFAAHIRRMRLLYRDQRDLVVGELQRRLGARIAVTPPEQGMHLVAFLRDGLSDIALEAAAARARRRRAPTLAHVSQGAAAPGLPPRLHRFSAPSHRARRGAAGARRRGGQGVMYQVAEARRYCSAFCVFATSDCSKSGTRRSENPEINAQIRVLP